MESDQKLKVLFLPAWYPNRNDNMLGLFVKRHAIAVSKYAKVSVLAVISDEQAEDTYQVETKMDNGITEILIYTKKHQSSIGLLNTIVNGYRYMMAHIAGWKILEQTDNMPDLNHVHILTRAGLMALFFKIRYKVPFLITEHWSRYLPHHPGGYSGALRKKLSEKVMRASEGITTVSKALKEGMEAVNLRHQNWHIIPNVVDTKSFQMDERTIENKVFRFSHISCFEEQSKNMSGILLAAKKLKEQGRDFELVMIGHGPDWEQTKQYAQQLGLKHLIHFTGLLENQDLVDEMSQCQCSILFSHYETFAIVIPENLSLGIPVIATNVGGIPEVLPKEFGKLIEPKDETALCEAMAFMMDHYQEYDSDAMRNYVEENYSYDEIGGDFFTIYQNIVSD